MPTESVIAFPSTTETQDATTSDGHSGVRVPPKTLTEPTVFAITKLPVDAPPPLQTKLDQYPGYVSVTASTKPSSPVTIAVCPTPPPGAPPISPEIRARLRLGHQ